MSHEHDLRPAPQAAPAPDLDVRIERSQLRGIKLRNAWPAQAEKVKGLIPDEGVVNRTLTVPTRVLKPNGDLLCIYLPGVLHKVMDEAYDTLTTIKLATDNRGLASGSVRIKAGTTRTRHVPVFSGVMGAMDPVGPMRYCRLTAFTAKQVEKWERLLPVWQQMAGQFEYHVPDRYRNQVRHARRTPGEWVIPGTPYTTITINNSYSTGVHTDKGDLDEGFSCLAVARKGEYTGGKLTFPGYGVGVDMQHGDLILMDAHEYHGNTAMVCECGTKMVHYDAKPCETCGAERISLVAYYRTKMAGCDTMEAEERKKLEWAERNGHAVLDAEAERDADLAAVTTTE